MTMTMTIALIVAGFLLLFFEIFVPGGLLGLAGIILLAVGIGGAFALKGFVVGAWVLCGCVVVGITGFYLWAKLFPKSRMGKKVILQDNAGTWHGFDDAKQMLVGKCGVAHTPLHPAGIAIIDGRRVDVITRGELLDPRTPVKVIKVEGNRVIVTQTE